MIVGTAGHVDHGKTALVRRLTGVDTDRLKEEKARGITIVLGFAYWPQPDGQIIGFIDVPGHEKFVHTMLAGASGIELLLLVVAADDGVMPQTLEHFDIALLLGIGDAVVAITKSDLVDEVRLGQVRADIDGLLAGTAFSDAPIISVSTVTGSGIAELTAHLCAHAGAARAKGSDSAFRLAVDRCFTLPGAGTIVTGTVLSGTVTVGDSVTVSPAGIVARVRSLHAQNRSSESGVAGDRCALNLAGPGISKDAISRGDMIVAQHLHAPAMRIDAEFTLLASEKKRLPMWLPVRLHHASAEVGARIVLLGDEIEPGATAPVQLVLETPIAAAALDRFVLRDTTASRTIGGGRFLDLRAPERHRRSPQRLMQLQALSKPDHAEALEALLAAQPHYADLETFTRDRALGPGGGDTLVERLDLVRLSGWVMLPKFWDSFSSTLLGTLKSYHADHPDVPGIGLERLRLAFDLRLPAPVFRAALRRLSHEGELVAAGSWIRRPEHEVRLTPEDESLWTRVAPLIGEGERFRPPRIRDIGQLLGRREEDIRRLFRLVSRRGDVHEVALDHFFLRDTVAEMVGVASDLAARDPAGFNAAQFRDRLDNGRKVAIQILEFFDRHGVTIRRGDLRRINRQRLDLFGPQAHAPDGGEASPVGRPDFKSGRGRQTVSGGFDSHSLPPVHEVT